MTPEQWKEILNSGGLVTALFVVAALLYLNIIRMERSRGTKKSSH